MPSVVLGVSGSVACYRAADLARELMRRGFTVRVCLTDAAQRFVSPALFEALTGQPCLVDAFDEPDRGRMAHIDWARQANVLCVAPATANTVARLAHGIGDDMLTTLALATTAPWVVAPAMNPQMYASDAHQAALRALATRAAWIVEPVEGEVACGEQGQGKLADIQRIADAVQVVAERSRALAGKRVLVTSGPTREPLDDVRFLTNRSSGKMGAALARAALLMGAEVTVVTGPTDVPLPLEAEVLRVETAEQMLKVALAALPGASLVVGAAAVADYRPSERVSGKMRRSDTDLSLNLTPNPDVIASLAKAADPGCKVVAFAAEPDAGLETAQAKLARKGVGAVAVNDVSAPGIGFDADENELTLVTADGQERSGRLPKLACALWLLERVSRP